jgi:hypothetical protein
MKPHYFDQDAPDPDDALLKLCVQQGYVPTECLLGGQLVYAETAKGRSACWGCEGPREKCGGQPRREAP